MSKAPAKLTLDALKAELKGLADEKKAAGYSRFFKTAPGEYGHGDRFYGITVPVQRKLAKKYQGLTFQELSRLLSSKIHEERFLALAILVLNFQKAEKSAASPEKERIYTYYLDHVEFINNWDLVDTSAPHIVGTYLLGKDRGVLYEFARSNHLWKKRISILSTLAFIRAGEFQDTIDIAKILLKDEHDLIHKAVGWMLREMGIRNKKLLQAFLKDHLSQMPRTMLRYAIEKFPEKERKAFLRK